MQFKIGDLIVIEALENREDYMYARVLDFCDDEYLLEFIYDVDNILHSGMVCKWYVKEINGSGIYSSRLVSKEELKKVVVELL